MIEYDRVLV